MPNPITKFFKKVDRVTLIGDDHRKQIKWLEAMKKVPLYVKNIQIYSSNAVELENFTDPNLHNTSIKKLQLVGSKSFNISSKTIENLQSIYPNSITIDYYSFDKDETTYKTLFGNFTKLLSKLDQTSLQMGVRRMHSYLKLEFSDVILKIVESNEEYSYIRAKSVEIRCEDKEYCWIK